VNAAAPQPLADKALQVAQNPQGTFVTRQYAQLVVQGFGLSKLRTIAYRANQGEALRTGELVREYEGVEQAEEDQKLGQLVVSDAPGGGQFVLAQFGFLTKNFKNPYQPNSVRETIEGLPLDVALISVSQQKNIVMTAVQGKPGTVKEFTSMGDYQINVKGALVGDGSYDYPEERVRQLVRLLEVPDSLEVASQYLQIFNVQDVVVESYDFPQREGYQNVQLVDINMVSDRPVRAVQTRLEG